MNTSLSCIPLSSVLRIIQIGCAHLLRDPQKSSCLILFLFLDHPRTGLQKYRVRSLTLHTLESTCTSYSTRYLLPELTRVVVLLHTLCIVRARMHNIHMQFAYNASQNPRPLCSYFIPHSPILLLIGIAAHCDDDFVPYLASRIWTLREPPQDFGVTNSWPDHGHRAAQERAVLPIIEAGCTIAVIKKSSFGNSSCGSRCDRCWGHHIIWYK